MPLSQFFNRETIISLFVASFPVLCLAYGKGYNLSPILLLITALIFCWSFKNIQYTKQVKWIIGTFSAYFLTYLLSMMIHGGKISDFDDVSRIIFAIPIFLLLLCYPPRFKFVINSIVIGSFIAGINALICINYFNQNRAFTNNNDIFLLKGYMPIQSGDMAMTLGLMSLTIAIYYLKKKNLLAMTISLVASCFGILASFLSGSRGGWIFLPLALLYLVITNRQLITKKMIITSFATLFIIILGIYNSTNIIHNINNDLRIKNAFNDISNFQKGNSDTSLGIRFELWKSALYTTQEHPILGAGYKERISLRKEWLKEKKITLIPSFLNSHSHNQYLEDLSVRGIIGLVALLAMFITPLSIFIKNAKNVKNKENIVINQCGAVSIIMMMGYCLTQSFFKHNSGVIFFPIITVIFMAMSLSMTKNKGEKE